MATTLPTVTVTPVEAGLGHHISCTHCPWTAYRGMRVEADQVAVDHERSHVVPDPADQVA